MGKTKFKSVEQFKKDIEHVNSLIKGLEFSFYFLEFASKSSHFKEMMDGIKEELPEVLVFEKERINNIHELGFIRLFASFESFMYEFLKELYYKYPNALPNDRKIQIGEILEWKTQKSIREYIIDHISIENSYDLLVWEKTLKSSFGIDIFKDADNKKSIELLNICRNSILHSGGKYNSRIGKDFRRVAGLPEGKKELFQVSKLEVFDDKIASKLSYQLKVIIANLEKT